MYKKLMLAILACTATVPTNRVEASTEKAWDAASIIAHTACGAAVIYWLKSHYETKSGDLDLYLKSGITLGLYGVYAPSILMLQGALWTRDLCNHLDVKLPGMRSFVPAAAGVGTIAWKTGVVSSVPDFSYALKLIKEAHVACKMTPDGGKSAIGLAAVGFLGVWSYIAASQEEENNRGKYRSAS